MKILIFTLILLMAGNTMILVSHNIETKIFHRNLMEVEIIKLDVLKELSKEVLKIESVPVI